jgi:hypothetical protein
LHQYFLTYFSVQEPSYGSIGANIAAPILSANMFGGSIAIPNLVANMYGESSTMVAPPI